MNEFILKKGEEIKKKVLDEAKSDLRKIENQRLVLEAEKKRRERDAKLAAEKKEKGIVDETEEGG